MPSRDGIGKAGDGREKSLPCPNLHRLVKTWRERAEGGRVWERCTEQHGDVMQR